MDNIRRNKGLLVGLMFDALNRKEVTDLEARNNYKSVLDEYITFLHRLSYIQLSSKLNNKLNKQVELLNKLDTLSVRNKNIGSIGAIPDNKLEAFLINIQNYVRDWIDADYFDTELRDEEFKWFSNSSNKQSMPTSIALESNKSEAIDILMDSARKRVDFGV
jgi:hypothetical protein